MVIALFLVFCPLCVLLERLPYIDLASVIKMLAEEAPNKLITLPRWLIKALRLTIVLISKNTVAWKNKVRAMLILKRAV